jgi:hypothetical protein
VKSTKSILQGAQDQIFIIPKKWGNTLKRKRRDEFMAFQDREETASKRRA